MAVTLDVREQQLNSVAQDIINNYERMIEPVYPKLLVRIMPKEQRVGSIYLPVGQNKTFYEGIVLRVWKPFEREFTGELHGPDGSKAFNKTVVVKSFVEVGDRVLFPHFEGLPVPFLDEIYYRLINEFETHPNGGVWGKLHLEEDRGLADKLNRIFKDKTCRSVSGK